MAKTIQCEIVSAKEEIFSGPIEMMVVTGSLGEIGILPGHAPLLTGLAPGPVRLKMPTQGGDSGTEGTINMATLTSDDAENEMIFYASGGYVEVQPGVITILADTAVRAEDLDEAAAEMAQRNAARALGEQQDEFQFGVAAAQLAEAAAQLRVLRRHRGRGKGRS